MRCARPTRPLKPKPFRRRFTEKPRDHAPFFHPSIDTCAQLRAQGVTPEQVERIELKVHSLVLELTGKKEPADGLQAKFSVYRRYAAGVTESLGAWLTGKPLVRVLTSEP